MKDSKALLLKSVSETAKSLVGLDGSDLPNWTDAFEKTISKMTVGDLDHLRYLLDTLSLKAKERSTDESL